MSGFERIVIDGSLFPGCDVHREIAIIPGFGKDSILFSFYLNPPEDH